MLLFSGCHTIVVIFDNNNFVYYTHTREQLHVRDTLIMHEHESRLTLFESWTVVGWAKIAYTYCSFRVASSRLPCRVCCMQNVFWRSISFAFDWSPNEFNIYKIVVYNAIGMWMNVRWKYFKSYLAYALICSCAQCNRWLTYVEHFRIAFPSFGVDCVTRKNSTLPWKERWNVKTTVQYLEPKSNWKSFCARRRSAKSLNENKKRKQNDRLFDIGRVLPFNTKIVIMCSMRCSILSRQFHSWKRNTKSDLAHSLRRSVATAARCKTYAVPNAENKMRRIKF